ncbi:MAG: galactonate dehydratase [Alphaproteobacteria bacterium]|jgi:galactonate dehydratase
MKITKVTPIHAGQFMFVRIETDSGIHGVGEGGAWGQIEASVAAATKFATYLEGEDPFPIEHHWNVMHRFSYFQGHAINAAISAIDIALWDIKGKALGVCRFMNCWAARCAIARACMATFMIKISMRFWRR